MARREFKGAATPTRLTSGIGAGDTSFNINDNSGWPTGGANGAFYVTLDPGTPDEERVLVGTQAGGLCSSVTRGQDNTSAKSHGVGADGSVIHSSAAVDYDEANRHINVTTDDNHTQYMRTDGTRHDLTGRHSAGTVVPTAVPTAATVGDVAAEGSGVNLARATHVHGHATGVPVSIGTANAAGVSGSFPRLDHVHEIGAGAIDGSPMFAAGVVDSAALGAAAVIAGKIAAGGVSATNQIADGIISLAKFLSEAGTSFTPTFTGATITLGTGGLSYGRYFKLGRLVFGIAGFRLGTGGNVTGGGAVIGYNLPASLTAQDNDSGGVSTGWITAARSFDSSTSAVFSGLGIIDPDECKAWVTAGASAEWNDTSPFNWDDGDVFASLFVFESTT